MATHVDWDQLSRDFEAAWPDDPDGRLERRLIEGEVNGYVNGHFFYGRHYGRVILRLSPTARHEILKLPEAENFERKDKLVPECVVVPPLIFTDLAQLRRWVQRALDYTSSLPAKKARAKKANPPVATGPDSPKKSQT
jgi:hypothetical protein